MHDAVPSRRVLLRSVAAGIFLSARPLFFISVVEWSLVRTALPAAARQGVRRAHHVPRLLVGEKIELGWMGLSASSPAVSPEHAFIQGAIPCVMRQSARPGGILAYSRRINE